jgi:hypothetical protein
MAVESTPAPQAAMTGGRSAICRVLHHDRGVDDPVGPPAVGRDATDRAAFGVAEERRLALGIAGTPAVIDSRVKSVERGRQGLKTSGESA